jgi:hypothetical protein
MLLNTILLNRNGALASGSTDAPISKATDLEVADEVRDVKVSDPSPTPWTTPIAANIITGASPWEPSLSVTDPAIHSGTAHRRR